MLSDDQIQHIAKLARLGLKEGESGKFSKQLSDILGYVDMLKEVDTEKVERLQVTGWKTSPER
jgi:aspartyl-tRNA(Asn)/glutamyl-tRNA(Gln) amidotransferase subunit C